MGETAELEKYGKPLTYDVSFKGPRTKRSCTDVLCLLVFLVFLGAWGFIAYFAFTNGDLNKLLVPSDSKNRKCGVDNQVLDKPYLFFFNLEECIDPIVTISGCPTPQICVKECPQETFVLNTFTGSLQELRQKLICDYDVNKDLITGKDYAQNLVNEKKCAQWYVKSKPLRNRCIPNEFNIDAGGVIDQTKLLQAIKNLKIMDLEGFGQKLVEDILNSWTTIVACLILAMVVSLIFIAIMRWIASPMVWFSIIGVMAGLGYSIYLTSKEYIYWRDTPSVPQHALNLGAAVKTWFQDKTFWLCLDIALSIILLVLFLVVIFLRKRIVIAIALIKEGSKSVSSVFATVFFPIVPWILQMTTIAFAIAVGLYLASIGDPMYKVLGKIGEGCVCKNDAVNYIPGGSCVPQVFNLHCHQNGGQCVDAACVFERLSGPKHLSYFHAFNVIGFFWLVFFVSAFGEMVLAGTFATWYWTFHKSDVPYFILTYSCMRTIRYHLGTLALGSLIITICRIIRVCLEFIDRQLKKYDNPFTRGILCCCKCFFWCLENFLRFINKNAYIMCAVHGKNFCTSAKDGFNLLMRNVLRVVTVDKVTDFAFFLSKLLITAAVGAATYFYVDSFPEQYKLHYNWVPTAIVVVATFLITTVFFGVYSIAVDTLFLCFLEDSERNDGSAEKPYFMSKGLMKILGKRNVVPRHQYN